MIAILGEPQKHTYEALLNFAATACPAFSLTWHMGHYPSSAHQIDRDLSPWRISQKITNHWPGTLRGYPSERRQNPSHRRYRIVHPKGVLLRMYQVTPSSIDILQNAEKLYAWIAPDRPEDLAFYLPDGKPLLASVAHEEMSWFMSDIFSQKTIIRSIPGIKLYER